MTTPPRVLTIAGSDSGGAAGLQADLKTFTALGVYGLTAVTAVTVQNSQRVEAVHPVPVELVTGQIDAVLSDYGATAVKTGFLGRADLVAAVADRLRAYRPPCLVVDPVLVNHRGQAMFVPEVSQAYLDHLLPLADLLALNLAEAALLSGHQAGGPEAMAEAARTLRAAGPGHVLLMGGRDGDQMVDLFFDGRDVLALRAPWIDTDNTHGSGDTFSAAVCAYVAQGKPLRMAVQLAHAFTAEAIQRAARWQLGGGHGPVAHW